MDSSLITGARSQHQRKPSPIASHIIKNSLVRRYHVNQGAELGLITHGVGFEIEGVKLSVIGIEPDALLLAVEGVEERSPNRDWKETFV